jgi:energy-converting hydrogenase A subunit R
MNVICSSLEGPLSPQGSAYNLMKLFPKGEKIFEVISRYDDLLTLESRPDYEHGDTLALIAPFLAYHGIKEKDIIALARRATITDGADQFVFRLSRRGWNVFCISTSYKQYTLNITQRLNIFSQNVACTYFPLDEISAKLTREDYHYLETIENEILSTYPAEDSWIKKKLDQLYWEALPKTSFALFLKQVRPVNGKHKVEALERFAQVQDKPLSQWVVIGDSITDFKMLQAVDKAGGLSIAFNANEFAIPHATMGLASTNLDDLSPVIEAWEHGKRPAVENLVKRREQAGGSGNRSHFHWIAGKADITVPLEVHKKIRRIVRDEAAKLG